MSPHPSPVGYGHVTFIKAGAGSGKTYRLTAELEAALRDGSAQPAGIIGTTFTVKAAAELGERVYDRLLSAGQLALAERSAEALIGTVHSVCERLLQRFAFELGLSPQLNVMSIEDGERFFNQALDQALGLKAMRRMNGYAYRLGMVEGGAPDWQRMVKRLADVARENDLNAVALRDMGERNAVALLKFFGEPLPDDPTPALVQALRQAAAMPEDGTKATSRYKGMLADAEAKLAHPDCPWQVWMRLAGAEPAKKSAAHAEPVQALAAAFERHPGLHRDLRGFLSGMFRIAADSLARFAQLKRDHGLLDFADLEQQALHALDVDAVRQRLASELDLLLVDEFQDTNPMQLALFLKLARLAKRAVFVGDVKQAIYEFRGCDPSLVFETVAGLAAGNAATDILRHSWRAQPPLADYVNELFAENFKAEMERESVVLAAERQPLPGPAVCAWTLPRKAGDRADAIVGGIAQLVADETIVFDPVAERQRPVRYGDIAVLARTNDHVEQLAQALRSRHIPMKMTLKGLLATAEVTLAKSCLRRVADRADTLATAEIMALAECREPEQWLRDRLDWLDTGGDRHAWGEADNPIIGRLAALRRDAALRSPVEIVARVLNEVDIRRIVTAWGPDEMRAAQRQKNLDAFLNLAVEYEKHAAAHHDPGTLTGFLFWLEHPSSPDLDLQPVVTSGDAVHVLTYHRAKGLEWPIVICTDLGYEERMATWDVRVEQAGRFDIERPLAGRELRYWPNIFGRRKSGVPVRDAIEGSPEGQACREKTWAERKRLAYVGLTRARDRLVLVVPESKLREDAWLASFRTEFAIPTGPTLTLPGDRTIATAVHALGEASDRQPTPYAPRWFDQRERREHPRRFLQPSSFPPVAGATIGDVVAFGERIALRGESMADVGDGLHAVIAAELVNPLPAAEARARAEKILVAHGILACLSAADAVAAAARWQSLLQTRFAPSRLEVEVPVRQQRGGQIVRGFVDLLAETAAGWVIVDHKSSPQRRSTWEAEALKHSGQLAAYRSALEAAGRNVAGCYIHFAVTGGLVEVRLPR